MLATPVEHLTTTKSKRHEPALDGLRGLAVLLVLARHLIYGPLDQLHGAAATVRNVFGIGWIGVDLFFVLSGFLITGILLDSRGQPHWWRNFVARRALRIFPLYYGVLFVVFVIAPQFHVAASELAPVRERQLWFWGYAVNVLTVVDRGALGLNLAHFWSLCIEEQFYLFWPAVIAICSGRRLLGTIGAILVAGEVARLITASLAPADAPVYAYVLTPLRLDGLMVGAAIAVIARHGANGLARMRGAATVLGGGAALLLAALFVWRGEIDYHDILVAMFGYPLIAIACGALLIRVQTTAPGTPLARAFGSSVMRWFGRYSYGVYVYHFPLLWLVTRIAAHFWPTAASEPSVVIAQSIVVAAITFIMARVSFALFESPFLALKRYFEPRSRPLDASEPELTGAPIRA